MRKFIALMLMLVILASCTEKTGFEKYETVVKEELNSGKKVNSLLLNIQLGMSNKEFFTYCWEMNKKGIFTDGKANTAVLYKLNKGELEHNATLNFYPEFKQNKIFKLDVFIQYDGWAPWNKHLFSDSLQKDILNMYKKWYPDGNPFITLNDKTYGDYYVKVDGNRQIIISKYDDIQVYVEYKDLSVAEPLPTPTIN